MIQSETKELDELFLKGLVDSHSGKLTRYVCHKTRNIEVSRDIVQEAFLRLTDVKKRRRPSQEHAIPWLYSVCRNLAIDYLRRQKKWVYNSVDIIDHHCFSSDPNPIDTTIRSETRELLKACISHLPETHKEVVVLKFEGGLSYREISGVTHLSESNVGFIIHQSVARLRYEMVKMM